MEEQSLCVRNLMTRLATQGLSENANVYARISMMARSEKAPPKGRMQKRKTNTASSHIPACYARLVHTGLQ